MYGTLTIYCTEKQNLRSKLLSSLNVEIPSPFMKRKTTLVVNPILYFFGSITQL
jgi:hypothetical protein